MFRGAFYSAKFRKKEPGAAIFVKKLRKPLLFRHLLSIFIKEIIAIY